MVSLFYFYLQTFWNYNLSEYWKPVNYFVRFCSVDRLSKMAPTVRRAKSNHDECKL